MVGSCGESDLCLHPAGECPSSSSTTKRGMDRSMSWPQSKAAVGDIGKQQQPLTIFYSGKICVCNVTEVQAKVILGMAKKSSSEEKEMIRTCPPTTTTSSSNPSTPSSPLASEQVVSATAAAPPPPRPPPPQLMNQKRSLQNFLQKRKSRISEGSLPYSRHHNYRQLITFL